MKSATSPAICEAELQNSVEVVATFEELARRVPQLRRANLRMLAEIGALNTIGGIGLHRRDALWQVEKAGKRVVVMYFLWHGLRPEPCLLYSWSVLQRN